MRQTKSLDQDEARLKRNRSLQIKIALSLGLIVSCSALAFVSRAQNQPRGLATLSTEAASTRLSATQSASTPALRHLNGRLSLQPEADKLRRLLGQRFTKPGRERATLVGTLTIGAQQLPVRIVRAQTDNGEQVEIALGGGPASLSWNGTDGALSGGSAPSSTERALIERLALDAPDQFIQAQLRGASYYTVAREVRPESAANVDDYEGPTWDLVRVGEPQSRAGGKPQSSWRVYYVNTSTGLIERIISEENGQTVRAELAGWINQGGEIVPTQITWQLDNRVVMELIVNNVGHGPK